jgi:hypothetical protein
MRILSLKCIAVAVVGIPSIDVVFAQERAGKGVAIGVSSWGSAVAIVDYCRTDGGTKRGLVAEEHATSYMAWIELREM